MGEETLVKLPPGDWRVVPADYLAVLERERDEARQRAERLPWDRPELYGWSIVGMNHYRIHGQRHLFVAMTKDGRCIQAEGLEEGRLFDDLAALAADPQPDEAGGELLRVDMEKIRQVACVCGHSVDKHADGHWCEAVVDYAPQRAPGEILEPCMCIGFAPAKVGGECPHEFGALGAASGDYCIHCGIALAAVSDIP